MRTYLIKRFLMMIPTIFGISLVVFTVINLAPGSPAAMQVSSSDSGKAVSADQGASKETYQIFKKQFSLDKPILFNHYPWLTPETIDRQVGMWINGSAKEKISASDDLTDYGRDAIPHVIVLLENARAASADLDPKSEAGAANLLKRRYLVYLLAQNSLIDIPKVERPSEADYSEGQKKILEINKERRVENNLLRDRKLPDAATAAQAARVERLWIGWFRGYHELWTKGESAPPEQEIPPIAEAIEAAFGPARDKGKNRALRDAGKTVGLAYDRSQAGEVVAWVVSRTDDFAQATVFGANVLDAMSPLADDALAIEKDQRRDWIKAMRFRDAHGEVRREYCKERWRKWWDGREEEFRYTATEAVATALFDTRFGNYWAKLAVFDFGESLTYKGKKVIDLISNRLKVSITFALASFLLAYTVAIPIGIYSAVWKDSLPDRVLTVLLFALYSLPSFFTAILLTRYLTIGKPFQWFPSSGFASAQVQNLTVLQYIQDVGWHLVLPVFCLSYMSFATLSRYMRSGLLEVIKSDYIRTARAKGLSEYVVILKHALRNGLIPILTMVGGILPALMGGSVILEYIFNIPGMGLLMLEAIFSRDYNVVMADSMIVGLLVLCGLLLTDILYVLVDPRISFE